MAKFDRWTATGQTEDRDDRLCRKIARDVEMYLIDTPPPIIATKN